MGKVEKFYGRVGRDSQYLTSWKTQVKNGNLDDADKTLYSYAKDRGLTDLGFAAWKNSNQKGTAAKLFFKLDGLSSTVGDMFKLIRMTTEDKTSTPAQKEQLIDSYFTVVLSLSDRGNQIFSIIDGKQK